MFINCSLKPSPETSHTHGLMDRSIALMRAQGVVVESIRLIDRDVTTGVYLNMREHGWEADAWPDEIWPSIDAADILVVGGALITGNEDGVKHAAMSILYSLQHIGFTIPPAADAGWIGAIGPGPSYLDPESGNPESDFTNRNTTFMTWNLLHAPRQLKDAGGIPAYGRLPQAWNDGERSRFDADPGYK